MAARKQDLRRLSNGGHTLGVTDRDSERLLKFCAPDASLAWTAAGGTTPTGCQGCLLHWENQLGSGVWHRGRQTDLEETKYTGSFLLIQVQRHGNLREGRTARDQSRLFEN